MLRGAKQDLLAPAEQDPLTFVISVLLTECLRAELSSSTLACFARQPRFELCTPIAFKSAHLQPEHLPLELCVLYQSWRTLMRTLLLKQIQDECL